MADVRVEARQQLKCPAPSRGRRRATRRLGILGWVGEDVERLDDLLGPLEPFGVRREDEVDVVALVDHRLGVVVRKVRRERYEEGEDAFGGPGEARRAPGVDDHLEEGRKGGQNVRALLEPRVLVLVG